MDGGGSLAKLRPALRDEIARTYILSYKEDVEPLQRALEMEGLNPIELRASYSDEQLKYSRNARCMLSHYSAWQLASEQSGYSLICEADFVPCKAMGSLPIFWPTDNPLAWGYLYQGSPRLLDASTRFLRGHTAPLVCYFVGPEVAKILCEFVDDELSRYDPTEYFNFDSHLQWFAMGRGAEAFIPPKHYGEHGGLPNPEHAGNGLRRSGAHRADALVGPLHFLPQYARGNWMRFAAVRTYYRLLGWGRLMSGRWICKTNVYSHSLRDLAAMQMIGVKRLVG